MASSDEPAVEASPAERARAQRHRRWLLALTVLGVLGPLVALAWRLLA